MTDPCAIGLSVHTGWAACCAVSGNPQAPAILLREIIELLGDPDRFVFHRAAELKPADAARSVAAARQQAARAAERALGSLIERLRPRPVVRCAIVAREGAMPPLDKVLTAHPRIHTAEGFFYRDVLRDAAESHQIATQIFPPPDLDANTPALVRAGKEFGPPWGKDQKLAALAAWTALATD